LYFNIIKDFKKLFPNLHFVFIRLTKLFSICYTFGENNWEKVVFFYLMMKIIEFNHKKIGNPFEIAYLNRLFDYYQSN
jgi:hypothetical protein